MQTFNKIVSEATVDEGLTNSINVWRPIVSPVETAPHHPDPVLREPVGGVDERDVVDGDGDGILRRRGSGEVVP